MAANANQNQPIGTNDSQSLWERIKDINADDFVGMVQTFFNEVADGGYVELNGEKYIIDTRALRNALQGKFIVVDIPLSYIAYKEKIREGNPPEEALGETLAGLLGGILGGILGSGLGNVPGAIVGAYAGSKAGEWLWDKMKDELANIYNQIDNILDNSLLINLLTHKPSNELMDNLFTNFTELRGKALLRRAIYGDPLVVDLDGDGIETIGLDSSNAMFDLDGDGFREKTGWISKDDGILVIDRNYNKFPAVMK